MFGIVNVVTKRAKDYSGARVIVESTLPISLRVGVAAGTEFKLFGAPAELTTQLEYFKQNGPDLFFQAENTGIDRFTGQPGRHSRDGEADGIWGGRLATRSYYADSPSGILRIVRGNTELHLQGVYYRHASPSTTGDFDDPAAGERETRAIASLKHTFVVSTLLELSARAYGNYYSTRNDFIASRGELCPFGNITCDYRSAGKAHWLGLELQSSWDWFRDSRFVTLAGVDARQRGVSTTTDAFDAETGRSLYQAPPGLDRSDVTFAAYAEQTYIPARAVVIKGGARVDSDPRFSAVVTPRLAIGYDVWEGGTLKASYAGAFRAPSWDEANNATARRILADGLRPEKVKSLELSMNQRVGTHRLLIGGFYSKWTDLVELATLTEQETIDAIRNGDTSVPFTPGVHLTQYRNTTAVNNYGLNTGVEGAFASGHLLYGASVTAAIAERRIDEPLESAAGRASAIWQRAARVRVDGSAADRRPRRSLHRAPPGGFVEWLRSSALRPRGGRAQAHVVRSCPGDQGPELPDDFRLQHREIRAVRGRAGDRLDPHSAHCQPQSRRSIPSDSWFAV